VIWDLPTRIFHWGFVVTIIGAYLSGENDLTQAHEYLGLAALGLWVFRVVWGFIGHETARFSHMLVSWPKIWAYLNQVLRKKAPHYAGHNPLGGLSVLAMLLLMGAMAVSGLWTGDDVLYEAPLTLWAPELFAGWERPAGALHDELHELIPLFIGLHLVAILAHRLLLGEALVSRMVSGKDFATPEQAPTPIHPVRSFFGLVLIALCVGGALSLSLLTPNY
jgi:cytochrome b